MSLIQNLYTALQITGPIVVILFLGVVFKRIHLIDEHFIGVANRLVFNVCLPCLLFLSVSTTSAEHFDLPLVIFAAVATVVSVLFIRLVSIGLVEPSKRGVFTQCAFRGNMAILGLALCVSAFGDSALPIAAMYIAFMTVLYNVLTVALLTKPGVGLVVNIAKNPLIISILAGALVSYSSVELPSILVSPISTLAKITLPLALLCIGGGLRLYSIKANGAAVFFASVIKLVIQPAAITIAGIVWGFRGLELGVLFLMLSTPTAAAAYVMSRQMSDHGEFAGEIITLSTILSPVSMTLGLVGLTYFGYL